MVACVDCSFTTQESCGPHVLNGGNDWAGVKLLDEKGKRLPQFTKPPEGDILAPWVCIEFMSPTGGNHKIITVGNNSSPPGDGAEGNEAVIKSFEYGQSDGFQVRIVIHDQQGGAFEVFMNRLFKDWKESCAGNAAASYMKFQFGWARAGCHSVLPALSSPCFYSMIMGIETNFTEGKFISELSGYDIANTMLSGGLERTYGSAANPMCLREAITTMLTDPKACPTVESVDFVRLVNSQDGRTTTAPCGFRDYDEDCGCGKNGGKKDYCIAQNQRAQNPANLGGIKHSWKVQAQDKVHVTDQWLSNWPTENNKAWRMFVDPGGKSKLLITEAMEPPCQAKPDSWWRQYCIGTYIVNGGKYSPVLEFNPKIKWDFTRFNNIGGANSNLTTNPLRPNGEPPTDKVPGYEVIDGCNKLGRKGSPGAGNGAWGVITPEAREDVNGGEGTDIANKSQSGWTKANESDLLHDTIHADLVLVGNPEFVNPWMLLQKVVGIVFINPFFITNEDSDDECGEWLAKPARNVTLSNGAWRIKSLTHRIELGKYTTTLGLSLTVGDVDQPYGLWTP